MTANLVPNGDLKAVDDLLRGHKDLEFGHKITLSALNEAARKFLLHRHLDNNSPTVGKVRTTLEGLTLRSRSKLAANIDNLPEFVVDMLFGEAPGATVALAVHHNVEAQSENDKNGDAQLLHSDGPAVAESIKTLLRHGDGTANPTGQVLLRRLNIVAGWVPETATVDDLARLLAGIMTIIEGSSSSEPARDRQLLCMAHRLIVAGSFGSRILYSSLISGLAGAEGLNGRAAFVSDTIPLVLADFQDRVAEFGGNPARNLTCLIVEEYVSLTTLTDRKQLLTLLSKCFPAAFVNQVRQVCDRLDRQFRVGNPQERRKKMRRWTHPHATWPLISDVLDAIWPAERGPLPISMKDEAKKLLDEVLLYADADLPPESDIESKMPDEAIHGSGRSDRNGIFVTGNNMINREHVEQVGLWRAHIWKLDSALLRLDREILLDLDPRSESDPLAKAEARIKRGHVDVLQTWRRELQQRLRQGDYAKGVSDKPRATGKRINIPPMPVLDAGEVDQSQIAQLVEFAAAMTA